MPVLVAALVLVGLLAVASMLCTLLLVRRMRQFETDLSRALNRNSAAPTPIRPGTALPAFTAVTVDGDPVADSDFRGGPALLGYFSTTCPSCEEALPSFLEAAAQFPGGRARVLAVVAGEPGAAAALAAPLAAVARTVTEPVTGGIGRGLAVDLLPGFALLDEHGHVTHSAVTLADLPALTAA
ncbi:TlpA family protein disulfide reductase [Kitasatospora sp. NPDC054939]